MNVCVVYFTHPPDLNSFAEACLQLTPQVAVREGEAVFLEIAGLKRILSVPGFVLRLQALLRRFQSQARIVIASQSHMALAVARTSQFPSPVLIIEQDANTTLDLNKISRVLNWSLGTEQQILDSLPIDRISDFYDPFFAHPDVRFDELCRLAKKLGISTMGDLKRLPAAEVNTRFGKNALEVLQVIHQQGAEVWPFFRIPETLIEAQDLPEMPFYSVELTLQPLIFTLRGLLDRLFARLRGRGQKCLKIVLRLELEKFSTVQTSLRELTLTLPVPQSSTHSLFPILQEQLQQELQRRPVESSPQRLELEVLQTTSGLSSQIDFLCKKEELSESFGSLYSRLRLRLGDDSVFHSIPQPHHLPEKSWSKGFFPWLEEAATGKSVSDSIARRPTRVLQNPIHLIFREGQFVTPGSGSSWKVAKADGPEKINLEWWNQPIDRDYYNILTTNGETLWVYFDQNKKQFYLQGYYD